MRADAPVKLSSIVEAHRSHSRYSQAPDAFGDGFLIRHNPICRSVRETAMRLGYELTNEDLDDYIALPLAFLPTILATKKIPFIKNASAFGKVEAARPNHFRFHELPPGQGNYMLHEAAHCISDTILKPNLFAGMRLGGARQRALRDHLCESFANTVEVIAWLYVDTETQKALMRYNNFRVLKAADLAALVEVKEQYGLTAICRALYCLFVYSNFLYNDLDRGRIDSVCRFAQFGQGTTTAQRKAVRSMMPVALGLNPYFRLLTSGFHFRFHHGIRGDIEDVLAFDFMLVLGRPRIAAAVDELLSSVQEDGKGRLGRRRKKDASQ